MQIEIITVTSICIAFFLTGVALVLMSLQIFKLNSKLKKLESNFEAYIKNSVLKADAEKKTQISYKEAIRKLRSGQSPEDISEETGVSIKELSALSKILGDVDHFD